MVSADAPFLRACRGEPHDRVPVWFMRQAGRSLPEYKKVREGIGMLESCLKPELAEGLEELAFDCPYCGEAVMLKAADIDYDQSPVCKHCGKPFFTDVEDEDEE